MAQIIINGSSNRGDSARASSPSHRDPEMETDKAVDVDGSSSASSSSSSSNSAAAKSTSTTTTTAMTEATTTTTTTMTTMTTTKNKKKKASSVGDGVGVGGNIEQQRAKSTYRYVEDVNSGLRLDMELRTMHHNSISDVQSIQVIETCFGKTLVTDGKTQSSAHDECVYHESLVHPAMFWCAHRNGHRRATDDDDASSRKEGEGEEGGTATAATGWPRSVFIGGGGELATAREVLRHSSTVKRVVMVDIDPDVVDVCRAYLPEWGGDAVLHHPTLEYVVGDARAHLRDAKIKFDVIIMDVTDPIEYGPAEALYNVEFYDMVKSRLDVGGVFVTQAGSAGFVPVGTSSSTNVGTNDDEDGSDDRVDDGSCLAPIRNTLARVFDNALPYTAPVPSFGEDWGYVIAYDDVAVDDAMLSSSNIANGKIAQVSDMTREYIDDMIEERIGTVPGVPDHESVIRDRDRRDGRSRRRNNNNNDVTTNSCDGMTVTTTTTIASNHASSMGGGGGSGSDGRRRGGKDVLRHYDGIAHSRLFALSKQLRESIMDDDRVMTEANPIYMY